MNMHWTSKPILWTEERTARLTELWTMGWSATQIASDLGSLTRSAVLGKVHRLKLPGRRTSITVKLGRPRKPETRPRMTHARREALHILPKPPRMPKVFEKPAGDVWEPRAGFSPMSLEQLSQGQCKWPVGDSYPYGFCGAPADDGKPYCGHHYLWSVGRGTPSERRAVADAGWAGRRDTFVPA